MNDDTRETDPHEVAAAWLAAMRAGDWEAAWQQTDRLEFPRRLRQAQPGFQREPHHLVWDGSAFDGARVRVRCLHGLGDTLQFMRFVPRVVARSHVLDFLVPPDLLPLLEGAPGLGCVSNAWTDEPPPCDFEIEVMELAYALRCGPTTLPPPYPHLDVQLAHAPVPDLGPRTGLRVALAWEASGWDRSRSVPLSRLAPLWDLPGIEFHSLQHGRAASDPLARHLRPTWRQTASIVAAAQALRKMDLVICVDGMPAHLAATLGRPTWLLLKHEADWRWGARGERTPWYPSMRLFRQPRPGDWDGIVTAAAQALQAWVAQH